MKLPYLNIIKPNDAWVLHREEIYTITDGYCNIYVLLDAYSNFCFGHILSVDLPSTADIIELLKNAQSKINGRWPGQILIAKNDPYVEKLEKISIELNVKIKDLPYKDIKRFIKLFLDSFNGFKHNNVATLSEIESTELEAFIPATYGSCPCASGKKFKYCCQKAFHDITFAMCAAEDGNLNEALHFMKEAELKIGLTAEILCRYAVYWSFFDQKKSDYYLQEALKINPAHPRLNYILGIGAKANKKYTEAIKYYQKAIDHYPKEDKFHLNEAYNNLGTVYFEIEEYEKAKNSWEQAFVLLPTDKMVKENLIEFIYENSAVPKNIREISPFIKKYLNKY